MSSSLPLSGLVVMELGTSVAAPVGAQILAELGAQVIKIENPKGGDDARSWGPPFVGESSALFHAINRNKRSATVDFKDAEQCAALRSFVVAQADVVIQNMRPGVVEKHGLDGVTLRGLKPSLIYCNLRAYGSAGGMKDRPGYDPLMQAFGGIMSITGHEGADPVRVAPSIVDQGTGMWAVIGILAALRNRDATGEGTLIETSLYETSLNWVSMHTANFLASGRLPRRLGSENPGISPYKGYQATDGWIVIAAGNDNLFTRFCNAVGYPEWLNDPDFKSNPERVKNRDKLNGLISDVIATASRDVWLGKLDQAGVPSAPMLTLDEVVVHPQCKAVGMLQDAPDGQGKVMGIPLQFDGVRPAYRSVAPKLGEANDLIHGQT